MGARFSDFSFVNRWVSRISQWLFFLAAKILGIRRIAESPVLVIVEHPRPCYAFHALAIPKRAEADFLSFGADRLPAFTEALGRLMPRALALSGLDSLALIVNGGTRQTFPLFHAHLISTDGLGDWDGTARFETLDAALASARERVAARPPRGYSIQLLFAREKADILLRIRYD